MPRFRRLDVKIRPVGKMVFTSGIYGDKIYGNEASGLYLADFCGGGLNLDASVDIRRRL